MLTTAGFIATTLIAAAFLLTLWRLLRGPSIPDRVLAIDTLYVNTVALIIVFGVMRGTALLFEAAMLIALLGFVSTVALCKYVLRGDIIE